MLHFHAYTRLLTSLHIPSPLSRTTHTHTHTHTHYTLVYTMCMNNNYIRTSLFSMDAVLLHDGLAVLSRNALLLSLQRQEKLWYPPVVMVYVSLN